MAIKEVRVGRTFYTVDSDTGQRVMGKKTQANIEKLNKKIKGSSGKKKKSSHPTVQAVNKANKASKKQKLPPQIDSSKPYVSAMPKHPTVKAVNKANEESEALKTKRESPHPEKKKKKTEYKGYKSKAWARRKDAREFDEEYEKAAGRQGPRNEHEAAMSGDYAYEMPSASHKEGQDAREWGEEAAKEESILKQEPGGRVVWNKGGFKKFLPDAKNFDRDENKKQAEYLNKNEFKTGKYIGTQGRGIAGEEYKLDSKEKGPDSKGPMGDEMWDSKGSMPPSPKPSPNPNVKPKPSPDVTPKPEEGKTTPEPKSPMQDEMWDAQKYTELTVDPKNKKKILLAEDLLKDKGKDETARIRESSGNFYIDPFTGFALDLDVLSRSNKRAEIMDLAKIMPADKRAAFLYQKGVIKKSDLDKMLEPTEKEQLDIDIQKARLNEYSLKAAQAELDNKNYRSPQEKEEFKMYGANYRNAVTNEDFQGQMYWGAKLKMSNDVIKKLAKKGQSTGVIKDVEKHWKAKYGHSYDLHKNRIKFQTESAKIFQEGDFTFNNQKYSGRKQFFVDNGLKEWESINAMLQRASSTGDRGELEQYFGKFSVYPKTRSGEIDLDKLTNKDDYNQFVARNFVHKAMATAYGGEGIYQTMLREYQSIVQNNPNYIGKVTNPENN